MIERLFELSHYYLRNCNKKLKREFPETPIQSRISILTGPKGVGKTTALIQHLLSVCNNDPFTRKGLYVPVGHTLTARYTLYEIADGLYKEGVKIVIFDDIHKYHEWPRDLKHIHRSYPDLKIFTAACAAMRFHETSRELKRRSVAYRMSTLSLREFIAFSVGPDIQLKRYTLEEIINSHEIIARDIRSTLKEKEKNILSLFNDYLRFGYYPHFIEHRDDLVTFYMKLEQDVRHAVESDFPDIYPDWSGRSISNVVKFLSLLTETIPAAADFTGLKKKLGFEDDGALREYLQFLEESGIILSVCGKDNDTGDPCAPGRLYFNNPNLVYALDDCTRLNKENIDETFFAAAVSPFYPLQAIASGDFLLDHRYAFRVGKTGREFTAVDEIESGTGKKIPLWIFGFLC
jgi:predicted AAA+ superfamily ATPase